MKPSNFIKLNIAMKPDDNGVYRMKHFYNDQYSAMFRHIDNLINTYGTDQVAEVIMELITSGVLSGNYKKG